MFTVSCARVLNQTTDASLVNKTAAEHTLDLQYRRKYVVCLFISAQLLTLWWFKSWTGGLDSEGRQKQIQHAPVNSFTATRLRPIFMTTVSIYVVNFALRSRQRHFCFRLSLKPRSHLMNWTELNWNYWVRVSIVIFWFLANVNVLRYVCYMLSAVRLSSVCLSICLSSVTLVHPVLRRLNFSAIFFTIR